MITSGGSYYYHHDRQGSIVALSDSSGNIVENYQYNAFGKCLVHTDPNDDGLWMTADDVTDSVSAKGNPYTFTGRRYDPETTLYYYRARMYDPGDGRFLQTDPIGYAGGLNLYTYCGNNPLYWIDPSGLKVEQIVELAPYVAPSAKQIVEVAPVVAPSATTTVIVIKGTIVGTAGVVAAKVAAVAAVAGGTGYVIGKYAVCPLIDKIPMDDLYDLTINREMRKKKHLYGQPYRPTKKRAKDLARQLGKRKPMHDTSHVPGGMDHWHPVDKNGKRIKGKHVFHPEFIPFFLPPDDSEAGEKKK